MATSQGIKLDTNTQARLKALAAKRDRTPHWLMRAAIERYLDQEEHYEQQKSEDMARWERYLTTSKAISHAKAEAWLSDLAQGKSTPWQQ